MELLILIGAGAGALLTVLALGRKAWLGFITPVLDFLNDWHGQPARAGRDEQPGVMARLKTLEVGYEEIRAQLTPNGGNTSSLGDRVVRIEHHLGTGPEPD